VELLFVVLIFNGIADEEAVIRTVVEHCLDPS
jgi:hypothetical protein